MKQSDTNRLSKGVLRGFQEKFRMVFKYALVCWAICGLAGVVLFAKDAQDGDFTKSQLINWRLADVQSWQNTQNSKTSSNTSTEQNADGKQKIWELELGPSIGYTFLWGETVDQSNSKTSLSANGSALGGLARVWFSIGKWRVAPMVKYDFISFSRASSSGLLAFNRMQYALLAGYRFDIGEGEWSGFILPYLGINMTHLIGLGTTASFNVGYTSGNTKKWKHFTYGMDISYFGISGSESNTETSTASYSSSYSSSSNSIKSVSLSFLTVTLNFNMRF